MDEAAASGGPLTEGGQFLIVVVLHRAGDGALRRRLIKLLSAGSAFRVFVSGLVLV